MSFGPPRESNLYVQPEPLDKSISFGPPGRLVSSWDLARRLKIKAREIGFDDPELSDKLYAEAKALEAGDALEVNDREL